MVKLTRRRVLTASALLLTSIAPACSRSVKEEIAPTLRRMARLLYPHAAVADAVYAQVADGLLADAKPEQRALLTTGVRALNKGALGGWVRLQEKAQIASLKAMDGAPFLAMVRGGVRDRLYVLPAVWKAIGYPGSSLAFGGYRTRGYDDVNWLPEAR